MTTKQLFADAARTHLCALPNGTEFSLDDMMLVGETLCVTRRGVWDFIDTLVKAGEIEVVGSRRTGGRKGGRPSIVYSVVDVRPNGRVYAKHNVVREYLREWYEPGDTLTAHDISDRFSDASARLQQLAGRGELEKVGKMRKVRGRRLVVYKIVALDTTRRPIVKAEKKPPKAALEVRVPSGWDGLLIGGWR